MEWEQIYPLVSVHVMQRGISDPTPLLVDSGEATHIGNKNSFSFELSWFKKADFLEMVAREWARHVAGRSSMERWQNKIRHLRQFLRGWARNESGIYKKREISAYPTDLDAGFESGNKSAGQDRASC